MSEGCHLGRDISEYTAQENFVLVFKSPPPLIFSLILVECGSTKEIFVHVAYLRLLEWISIRVIVLGCKGCCNKVPHTGWLKRQKCIVSQSEGQKFKVKASSGWVPSAAVREGLVQASLLVSSNSLARGSITLPLTCVLPVRDCLPRSPLHKDTRHIGLGAHQTPR